ncbi:hypothetical protein Atai01_75400 [Amycolatopsis taiwanensis]|uniref:Uncharacterized protein n=1 Tax=Amycolatopsis taiwanensis TaxID=342230 RepID=A0A9W6R860_9PSEU|nr:hypothetical protein Atai01_75400 [Amycolatopsis taiwanensis]
MNASALAAVGNQRGRGDLRDQGDCRGAACRRAAAAPLSLAQGYCCPAPKAAAAIPYKYGASAPSMPVGLIM